MIKRLLVTALLLSVLLVSCNKKEDMREPTLEPILPNVLEEKELTFEDDIIISINDSCSYSVDYTDTHASVFTDLDSESGYTIDLSLYSGIDVISNYEKNYDCVRVTYNDWDIVTVPDKIVAVRVINKEYVCILETSTLSLEDLQMALPEIEG